MPLQTLTLIRHGDNERDWSLGDAVGLSDIGVQQIQLSMAILDSLKTLTGSVLIISADMPRAQQSSDIFANNFTSASHISQAIDNNVNGKCMMDWFSMYLGIFSPDYKRKLCSENLDPDHIVIITHAHNPLTQLFNIWIDPSSAVMGISTYDGMTNEELINSVLSEPKDTRPSIEDDQASMDIIARDKTSRLRPNYGGVSHYQTTHKGPIFSNDKPQPTGRRRTAFSPWIKGFIPS